MIAASENTPTARAARASQPDRHGSAAADFPFSTDAEPAGHPLHPRLACGLGCYLSCRDPVVFDGGGSLTSYSVAVSRIALRVFFCSSIENRLRPRDRDSAQARLCPLLALSRRR